MIGESVPALCSARVERRGCVAGIVWIASHPKSGNTWVRIFLANLLAKRRTPIDITAAKQYCASEANPNWYRPLSPKPLAELTDAEIAALRPCVQAHIARTAKRFTLLKTHSFLGIYRDHPLISMEATAGAIYIVRDPRDVAISAMSNFGLSLDETISAMTRPVHSGSPAEVQIYEVSESWSNHIKSWTQIPNPRMLVVRYEDMLARPRKTFGAIPRVLDLDGDPELVKRAIKFSSFKDVSAQERAGGFTERSKHADRFFVSGRGGGWRKTLTPAQAKQNENDHGEQMRRFGCL